MQQGCVQPSGFSNPFSRNLTIRKLCAVNFVAESPFNMFLVCSAPLVCKAVIVINSGSNSWQHISNACLCDGAV